MTRVTRVLLAAITLLMIADFVFHGVLPALTTGKNDFSDPYVGAWLWRRRQNPYDPALVNATARQLTHSTAIVAPIYPPTAYVLAAPFSLLPWGWANEAVIWLSIVGVAITAWTIIRMGNFPAVSDKAWFIVAFIFAFAPFHTAIHLSNLAPIAIACCLLAVYLTAQGHDTAAGIMIAVAGGLKPQLGLWFFVFYLLRRRWRLVRTCLLVGGALAVAAVARIPLSLTASLAAYRHSLHYWFGPGGQNDFSTANPIRLRLATLQVLFYPLLRDVSATNLLAYGISISGMVIWACALLRGRVRSDTLALSSLLALSFLCVYHSVNDFSVLTLALCWALGNGDHQLRWPRRVTLFLLTLLLLPGASILIRLQPHLSAQVEHSWWWNFVAAPYVIWVLFALSITLLSAVLLSAGRPLPQVAAISNSREGSP